MMRTYIAKAAHACRSRKGGATNSKAVLCAVLCLLLFVGCAKVSIAPQGQLAVYPVPAAGSPAIFHELSIELGDGGNQFGAEVMIYAASAVALSTDEVESLAAYMNMRNYRISRNRQVLSLSDAEGNSITVFKASGSIQCSCPAQAHAEETPLKAALSDEECIALAESWLAGAGLLTSEYRQKQVVIQENGWIVQTLDDGTEVRTPTVKTVEFMFHDLSGLEVGGVAPRITVDIALGGEVVSVFKIQRSFTEFKKVSLLGVERAAENLIAGIGVIYAGDGHDGRGVITSAKLAYYNTNVADASPYLVPVYIFEGESNGEAFTAVTYAIELGP